MRGRTFFWFVNIKSQWSQIAGPSTLDSLVCCERRALIPASTYAIFTEQCKSSNNWKVEKWGEKLSTFINILAHLKSIWCIPYEIFVESAKIKPCRWNCQICIDSWRSTSFDFFQSSVAVFSLTFTISSSSGWTIFQYKKLRTDLPSIPLILVSYRFYLFLYNCGTRNKLCLEPGFKYMFERHCAENGIIHHSMLLTMKATFWMVLLNHSIRRYVFWCSKGSII